MLIRIVGEELVMGTTRGNIDSTSWPEIGLDGGVAANHECS